MDKLLEAFDINGYDFKNEYHEAINHINNKTNLYIDLTQDDLNLLILATLIKLTKNKINKDLFISISSSVYHKHVRMLIWLDSLLTDKNN